MIEKQSQRFFHSNLSQKVTQYETQTPLNDTGLVNSSVIYKSHKPNVQSASDPEYAALIERCRLLGHPQNQTVQIRNQGPLEHF